MQVSQARAFLAVSEELHFGRAADRLHMAQPPLSRTIRRLEDELGVVLFVRTSRTVRLTAQGEALVEPARELVMLSERMREIVRRVDVGETGRARLGFAGQSVRHIVFELARALRERRPGIVLDLHSSQFSYASMEKLRAGTLDAVIGRWDFLPPEVDSMLISTEELVVALPEGHRLGAGATVAIADLADIPWIVLPGGAGATLSNRLQILGIRGRFVPRIVEVAPDSPTQLLLVATGAGATLTFSGIRDNIPAEGVVFRGIHPPLGDVEVRLAWRRGDDNPAVAVIVALIRELFVRTDGADPDNEAPVAAEA
jgi:DNA-binding transcriptional LysR family regulator